MAEARHVQQALACLTLLLVLGSCQGILRKLELNKGGSHHGKQQGEDSTSGCSGTLPEGAVVGSVLRRSPGSFEYFPDLVPGAVATGVYVDSLKTTSNFGKLRISTSNVFPDADQFFALGFLEGYLTANRMYDNFINIQSYFNTSLYPGVDLAEPLQWLVRQDEYARQQVAANPDVPFWRVQGYLLRQFDGMVAGYQARYQAHHKQRRLQEQQQHGVGGKHKRQDADGGAGEDELGDLSRLDLMFLNGNGDLYDVIDGMQAAANASGTEALKKLDPHAMTVKIAGQGKCSALIKVAGDLSDLYIGHATWDSYTAMLRIFKHYEVAATDKAILSHKLSFSSYPGELASDDDFYITDTGLVVLETTNHIFNDDILAGVTWRSALSWQRVRAALLMADNGQDWLKVFDTANSGTYNNQYMVLDLKRFKPRLELQPGLLWVVEQLPGIIDAEDVTEVLGRGYWPSYNVPYFPRIYNMSGYRSLSEWIDDHGTTSQWPMPGRWLKYQVSPRANIFRRDQGAVDSLETLKDTMRSNSYMTDAYSEGSPLAAVCSRFDLDDANAESHGCYDGKVTSWSLAQRMQSEVVGGPTRHSDGGLPAFDWADPRWAGQSHRGMPQRYESFQWERMVATELPLPDDSLIDCKQGRLAAWAAGAGAGAQSSSSSGSNKAPSESVAAA